MTLYLLRIFVAIFPGSKVANILYASLGAFIFGVYIIFDTQMMMGGKHKYALDPEEYIFASLNLYLDVINLFMYILSIIGQANNNWDHISPPKTFKSTFLSSFRVMSVSK